MHWLHSVDQIVYRLGAACFTQTEFARVLYELREDRKHAMASAYAESHRSRSREASALLSLEDNQEAKHNVLRAQATMLEDGARSLLARPAFVAAQIELGIIEHILSRLDFDASTIPYAFYACQKYENTLSLLWKAFVEHQTFGGQINFDTRSELLSRGLRLPDFSEIETRDQFLARFNIWHDLKSLKLSDLDDFYGSALKFLSESPLLKTYREVLQDAESQTVFLGNIPQGIRTLEPTASSQGSSGVLPRRKPRR